MRDDDELGLILEFLKEADESVNVGFVEWSVHLVKDAEGAGFDEVDPEKEAEGRKGPFPPGEEVDTLGLLSPRRRVNLDGRFEGIVLVFQPKGGFPTFK